MVTEGVLNPSSSEHKYAKHFYSFVHVEYKTCFPLKKEWLSCVALHCRLIFTCMCTSLSCESIYNIPCYTDGVWHMCMESCWQRISLSLWSYGICIAWELTKMPAVRRVFQRIVTIFHKCGVGKNKGVHGVYTVLYISGSRNYLQMSIDHAVFNAAVDSYYSPPHPLCPPDFERVLDALLFESLGITSQAITRLNSDLVFSHLIQYLEWYHTCHACWYHT